MAELLNYLHSFSTASVQVTMAELLNYLYSFSTASVQVKMTELPAQFQCQIQCLSPKMNRCDFQICRLMPSQETELNLAYAKTPQTL